MPAVLETIIDVLVVRNFRSLFPSFIGAITFYLIRICLFLFDVPPKKKENEKCSKVYDGRYFAAGRHLNINSHSLLCSINSKKTLIVCFFVCLFGR